MSRAKDQYERQTELGYSSVGEMYVCERCFVDYAIKDFIEGQEKIGDCSYCDKRDISVSYMDNVIAFIMKGVRTEWGNPVHEGITWESREGGWQWNVSDTDEVLFGNIGLEVDGELYDDILSATWDNEWVEKDPYMLSKDKTLIYGWESFSELVKHKIRYVFFKKPALPGKSQPDEIEPVDILEQIGRITNELDLFQILTAGTEILRVRVTETNKTYSTAKELGTPPTEYARFSNRMSPAGIPMFYGAFDYETAVRETYTPRAGEPKNIVCGTFEVVNDIKVLDLTKIPDLPSIFDQENNYLRTTILFLQDFVQDISRPIFKDGREHIEYVPTQVVTEYFRHLFHITEEGARTKIDGILFPSAQDDGAKACVLFVTNEQCADKGAKTTPVVPWLPVDPPMLELTSVREEVRSPQNEQVGLFSED